MAISKLILNGVTQMDVTGTTALVGDVASGKKFTLADGTEGTGTGSGGGGVTPVEESDVNFIDDYDGTIVYSYTAAEFANLSALPPNPSHTGLTAQGWNWTLSDAKTYVATYGKLWIGQSYATVSGDTEIVIDLIEPRLSPYLCFAINGTAEVDWGDGSTHSTVTGTSLSTQKRTPHSYPSGGRYCIKIHVVSGSAALYGTSTYPLLSLSSNNATANKIYSNCVKRVYIGQSMSIGAYAFTYCHSLETVTIPISVTNIGNSAFYYCIGLKSITVPNAVTSIGNSMLNYCYGIKYVSLSKNITSIGTNTFVYCYSLYSVTLPPDLTTISNSMFYYLYSLVSVIIPNTITTIDNSAFSNCISLTTITIPSGVTTIGTTVFGNDKGLGALHFKATTPPTVSNSNAFSDIPTDCIIYVPASTNHTVLDAYKTATNYPDPTVYTYVEE